MWRRVLVLVGSMAAAANASCAGANGSSCGAGRTLLDGVCVSEPVADYVACVRAQGAKLGSDTSKKLSADASFAGVHAGTDMEAKDKLEKQYATSDANTLEIIRQCGAMRASTPSGGQGTASPPGARRFHYFYTGDTQQRRDWSQDGDTWTERTPDGTTTAFSTLGPATVEGQAGLELRREPDDGDRLFVPNPGAAKMFLFYKPRDSGTWGSLGPIIDD
jgi:hypothetical protein